MNRLVVVSTAAQKQLRKVPHHVAEKLLVWARAVESYGLEEVRQDY